MLLLLLFIGGLASCAAQTTVSPSPLSSTETSTMTAASAQATPDPTSANPEVNVIAILQTAVISTLELNETTAAPVLHKLYEIIQDLKLNTTFSLSLKSIAEV